MCVGRGLLYKAFFAVCGLAAMLLWIGVWCGANPAAEEEDGMGYSYGPQLPNSPWRVHDRRRPQPPFVEPGERPGDPPADAIVLFNGKDLSCWESFKGYEDWDGPGSPPPENAIEDGCLNILKAGWLRTKQQFGDCQFHIEWAVPAKRDAGNLYWGNSGIFFMGKFELQILESRENRIYADGMAGSIYGQTPPMVSAARKPGQWQSFDVVFTAPRFLGEKLFQPAYMTVFWNGVVVQYHTLIMGATRHLTFPSYNNSRATVGPIILQPHGSAVRFRNIWIRPLKLEPFGGESQPPSTTTTNPTKAEDSR